jgi:hypothetical protein
MIPSILWSRDKRKGWALETLINMRSKIDCSNGQGDNIANRGGAPIAYL